MSAFHRKTVSPDALSVARADWGVNGRREALPVCLEGSESDRAQWTSTDPKMLHSAMEKCEGCGRRQMCVRLAIDSSASGGVYGGFLFDTPSGRRSALVWIGDLEAKPRRRSPNRRQVAS